MGMLGNYGQGAQSFADSFMKTYLGVQQNQRANQELGMMEKYRQAQMQAQAEQTRMQTEAAAQEATNRRGMMSAIQNSVTPGGEYVAQGDDPTTGDMQTQGIPYDPKMDFGKAMTGAMPYIDKNTVPQFEAMMKVQQLPAEDRKAALAELVGMSTFSRNEAQRLKALQGPEEKTPTIPLLIEEVLPGGTHKQKLMWDSETKAHTKKVGAPEPIHVFAPKDSNADPSKKLGGFFSDPSQN
jgi:hypothetical protein